MMTQITEQLYKTNYKKKIQKQRSYFDSAEFFMTGKISEPHPNIFPPQVISIQPEKTVPKKALRKTRKYFDSADWMTNGNVGDVHKYK